MKRISIKELPEILTSDIINILAFMSDEVPQSSEWQEIFSILSDEDYRLIMDRKIEIQDNDFNKKEVIKTVEEKLNKAKVTEKSIDNLDPDQFIGNMGQPETLEEYKNRYGQYPIGYDKKGNKI
jgi:hypothetical protein